MHWQVWHRAARNNIFNYFDRWIVEINFGMTLSDVRVVLWLSKFFANSANFVKLYVIIHFAPYNWTESSANIFGTASVCFDPVYNCSETTPWGRTSKRFWFKEFQKLLIYVYVTRFGSQIFSKNSLVAERKICFWLQTLVIIFAMSIRSIFIVYTFPLAHICFAIFGFQ